MYHGVVVAPEATIPRKIRLEVNGLNLSEQRRGAITLKTKQSKRCTEIRISLHPNCT